MRAWREFKRVADGRSAPGVFFARLGSLGALIVGGVIFGVIFGECALRLTGFVEPHLITYDSVRGWALMPGGRGWQGEEGGADVKINRQGFRGPERLLAKPRGVFRVAVLGDSFTEAQQLPYEQTFSAVMERELARCPVLSGRKVEVLNFGVDSYGTAQELLTLREQALKFSPDFVVVAFFVGNDVRNNSLALEGDKCRPFFDVREGALVAAGPFAQSPAFRLSCMARFLSRYSQVLNLLGDAKSKLREAVRRRAAAAAPSPAALSAASSRAGAAAKERPADAAGTTRAGASNDAPRQGRHEVGINDRVYLPPADSTWHRAWDATEAELAAIARLARDGGAQVLVVTLSVSIQVYPDPRVPADYARELGVADVFGAERRLAAAAARDGYPELNLAPPMAAYARAHHVFLHGFANTTLGWGHWNQLGHRVGGTLIAERVCADLSSAPVPPRGSTAAPADVAATGKAAR